MEENEKKDETSHCESSCFAIEARLMYAENPPFPVLGQIIDSQWRRVLIDKSPFGVPDGLWSNEPRDRGYLSYAAAMAIGWWFLAEAHMRGVEFRLVEYKVVTDVRVSRGCEGAAIQQNYGMWLNRTKQGDSHRD